MSCSAMYCSSRTTKGGVKDPELSFHTFPKCPQIRREWIKAVGRDNWEPTKHSRLCSKHFETTCYVDGLVIRKLKTDAVPTIFEGYPFDYQSVQLKPGEPVPNPSQLSILSKRKEKLNNKCSLQDKSITDPNAGKDKGVQQTDILCKNCQNVIVGFRYKCITCEDYDLCKKCEMMETHSEHYVLRIPKPLKSKEAEEIAQKLQRMFELDEGIPPIDIKEEDPIGIRKRECDDDEQIEDDNVDEDVVHSSEQFKNITPGEVSRVIDKSKDVGEPTGTVRRKRKRTGEERETVDDGKRMRDVCANAAKELALADANSDSNSDDYYTIEIKEEICENEESSEIISRLEVGETVNPYVKENQL